MTVYLRSAGLLAALALIAGCQEKKKDEGPRITIHGRIVDKDKPFSMDSYKPKLPPGTSTPPAAGGGGSGAIQLAFYPADNSDVRYARVNQDMTFDLGDLKPGKYKIVLTAGNLPPGTPDPFGGKFTQEKSKIVRDLNKDGEDIVIDISKPQG